MRVSDLLEETLSEVDAAHDMCRAVIRERWSFAERMQGDHQDTDLWRLHQQLDSVIRRLNEARAML